MNPDVVAKKILDFIHDITLVMTFMLSLFLVPLGLYNACMGAIFTTTVLLQNQALALSDPLHYQMMVVSTIQLTILMMILSVLGLIGLYLTSKNISTILSERIDRQSRSG